MFAWSEWFYYFMLYTGIFLMGMLTGMIYILIAQEWSTTGEIVKKVEKRKKRRIRRS